MARSAEFKNALRVQAGQYATAVFDTSVHDLGAEVKKVALGARPDGAAPDFTLAYTVTPSERIVVHALIDAFGGKAIISGGTPAPPLGLGETRGVLPWILALSTHANNGTITQLPISIGYFSYRNRIYSFRSDILI